MVHRGRGYYKKALLYFERYGGGEGGFGNFQRDVILERPLMRHVFVKIRLLSKVEAVRHSPGSPIHHAAVPEIN